MGMKYRASTTNFRDDPNGSRVYYTDGPFSSIAKIERCLCEDGIHRTAQATAEPDTFFTIPACVYIQSKTVAGFVTHTEDGWKFITDTQRKNASLIKKEPA